jgi:DNA-binding protein H-NS
MATKKLTPDVILAYDFEELDFDQLNTLMTNLKGIVEGRKEAEKNAFADEIRERADKLGVGVEELFEQVAKKQSKTRAPVKPKYKLEYEDNSLDPILWSGRGRKPTAIVEWLAENPDSTIDELLIPEDE